MTLRDHSNHLQIKRLFSPLATPADNTAQVSQIIDVRGARSVTLALSLGALADAGAQFTVLLEESDASDMSGAAAVADADMISQTPGTAPETAASFTEADDNEVRKVGYIGAMAYIRATITPANNGTASYISGVAILEMLNTPVTQAAA
jgi:hypothetical protein